MDRDLALALIDVLEDIKDVFDDIKLDLDAIVTNTTPADGGDNTPADGEGT